MACIHSSVWTFATWSSCHFTSFYLIQRYFIGILLNIFDDLNVQPKLKSQKPSSTKLWTHSDFAILFLVKAVRIVTLAATSWAIAEVSQHSHCLMPWLHHSTSFWRLTPIKETNGWHPSISAFLCVRTCIMQLLDTWSLSARTCYNVSPIPQYPSAAHRGSGRRVFRQAFGASFRPCSSWRPIPGILGWASAENEVHFALALPCLLYMGPEN